MAIKTVTKEEDFFNRINEFKIKIIPMTDEQRKECFEEWNNFVAEFSELDNNNYYCRVIQNIMQQVEDKMLGRKPVEKEINFKDDFGPFTDGPENFGGEKKEEQESVVLEEPKDDVLNNVSVRSPEVEEFYQKLIAINNRINDAKQKDSGYLFDDIIEFNNLVVLFNELNITDQDCIDIMRILEGDVNKTIAKKKENVLETPDKIFVKKLKNIFNIVKSNKDNDSNYLYDNEEEYKKLFEDFGLSVTNNSPYYEECNNILNALNEDISLFKNKKEKMSRTPEEENFYRILADINLQVENNKKIDPNYVWDNVDKYNKLLERFKELNTVNQDCIDIMRNLEREISPVLVKNNTNQVIELPPVNNELSPIENYVNKVSGIISWLNEEKNNNPGFRYNNEEEFIELLKEAGSLGISDPNILDMLITLSEDLHGDILDQQKKSFNWLK